MFWYLKYIPLFFEYFIFKTKMKLLGWIGVGVCEKLRYGNNLYQVSYFDGTKKYKIIIKKKRGPSLISKITSESEENITDEVQEFIGPSRDFHNSDVTPHILGRHSISFHLRGGSVKTFEGDDVIKL